MNEQPFRNLPDMPEEEWENAVQQTARSFPYPETPDIAAQVSQRLHPRQRRLNPIWRVAVAAVLIFLFLVLAVPQVRAVVLEFIQIGTIRIVPVTPTATTAPNTPTLTPDDALGIPNATTIPSVLNMPGETTLADARARSGFDFGLPTYPADLGAPDHVYLQEYHEKLVTLVWMSHDDPSQVRLTLEILDSDLLGSKFASMSDIQYPHVNGSSSAMWLPNPHWIYYFFNQGSLLVERAVQGNTLIWTVGKQTYRIEGNLTVTEAVQIAESLR